MGRSYMLALSKLMKVITSLPEDFLEKVEFDRIVALQAAETLGPGGLHLINNPVISTDAAWVEDRLALAFEELKSVSAGESTPLRNYEDLSEAFKMLTLEGYTMSLEELVQINILLRDLLAIDNHFRNEERAERYPRLLEEIRKVPPAPHLNAAIDQIIDDKGEIRPDASPELAKIRRQKQSIQREIDNKFRGVVQKYRERDLLADTVESYRNGRRVLTVAVANKRKIRGIIHDLSATGQTAYIEPEEVISLNNDLFDLNNEERREIMRLLKALSATLRPELELLEAFDRQRASLDALRAQAVIARRLLANKPQIQAGPHLEMFEARHPLLYLKFKEEGRKVVPFTLKLNAPNRLLLLSGPNAGGKSIMLKGAGLLQIMVQAGMLVPCGEDSVFGMFENFCADIGDQQSLDDDLSTYSSHLRNMRQFLEVANSNTFLVIDEFGSGTDPKLGGAVAESILRELNRKKVWGVITTHYGNLKAFVYKQKGIVNGAMVFDVDTLDPTYEMRVGKPGSSYAFEVATKAGLSPKLLDYARGRVKGNEHEVDKLLLDLEREKARAEDAANLLEQEKAKFDKLSKTYTRMQRDLEVQRKTFKLETQERSLQAEARQQKELERIVRDLRESESVDDAKKVVKATKVSRKKREEVVAELKEELNEVSAKTTASVLDRPIQEGDHVRLIRGGATGEIVKLERGKATVQMGELRITANLKDLEAVRKPVEINRTIGIKRDLKTQEGGFKNEIDVRGFRREEVLDLVQDFIDRGMIENVKTLKILHGKGNGTLRNAVREKLREYKNVKASHPSPNQGGDGVTIVDL
jgi:DNA mismatch repair protein MutS2